MIVDFTYSMRLFKVQSWFERIGGKTFDRNTTRKEQCREGAGLLEISENKIIMLIEVQLMRM
jgi:hypothetical protein